MNHSISRLRIMISYALRDISKSRIILACTIIGLSAAFTAVFLSVGVEDGFQVTLRNGSVDTGGEITIKPNGGNGSIENTDAIKRVLDETQNVGGYSFRSYGGPSMQIAGVYKMHGYAAIGVDPIEERSAVLIPERIIAGRYLLPTDTQSVVIGVTLADSLVGLMYDGKQIEVGDVIRYGSPLDGRWRDYRVVGIVDAKYFHPNWSSYFPKKELEWLDDSHRNIEIAVKLKDPSRMEETKTALQSSLQGVQVITWREREGYVMNIMDLVGFITGTINRLLVVTTFVIISVIIFINVFQKRRQIAILKAMGADNSFVVAVYLVETLVYTVLSFAIGFLLFLLIDSYLSNHPTPLLIGDFRTVVVVKDMTVVFGILSLASFVGSIFPSYIAVRTRIVDILREIV